MDMTFLFNGVLFPISVVGSLVVLLLGTVRRGRCHVMIEGECMNAAEVL